VARLRAALEGLADWPLVGVHALTGAHGSLVQGLAVAARRIDAGEALAASQLDELVESERWGRDAETERRHAALRREVEAAADFLARLQDAPPR
jgi:chaperone required for assembly of F1-ATPase